MTENLPASQAAPKSLVNKKFMTIAGILGIAVVVVVAIMIASMQTDPRSLDNSVNMTSRGNQASTNRGNIPGMGDPNSFDPLEKGKALAGGNCTGQGSKVLGSAPMRPEDLSVIVPYGLLAGGHVTPIDHQYYWGKVQMGAADMYDVLSPGDGKLVQLQYRDRSSEGRAIKGDYRGVITYSCTFFSYFDLATSLSPEIQAQLPANWERKGVVNTDIDLKQGQVIGKVGGQSLDFAIWDTTKSLKNLLVPVAYNNYEPWKLVTVSPLDYFSDSVKAQILPYYARKNAPLDGKLDFDIDGMAVGNWFEVGTNGYMGSFNHSQGGGGKGYWAGHLAIVPNHLDDNAWMFSIGDVNGNAEQYAIKNPTVKPDMLNQASGIVKYQLSTISYIDSDGSGWLGDRAPKGNITLVPGGDKGVALVQMLDKRRIKVEVFIGKSASQVTEFTAAAKTYDRGDNAKMVESNTAF